MSSCRLFLKLSKIYAFEVTVIARLNHTTSLKRFMLSRSWSCSSADHTSRREDRDSSQYRFRRASWKRCTGWRRASCQEWCTRHGRRQFRQTHSPNTSRCKCHSRALRSNSRGLSTYWSICKTISRRSPWTWRHPAHRGHPQNRT